MQFPKTPRRIALISSLFLSCALCAFAQETPWETTANKLKAVFVGPLATALICVAVVVTGIVFAFSEGQGKRQVAGLILGASTALGAARLVAWLTS